MEEWGEDRTDAFLAKMRASIARLAAFPDLGSPRPALHPMLRSLRFEGYLIFYVNEPEGATVVAVLHERRNHAALDFSAVIEGDR